jgi:GT2 family glycosyltransferase
VLASRRSSSILSGGGSRAPRIPSAFNAGDFGQGGAPGLGRVTTSRDETDPLDDLEAARRRITELEAELGRVRAELVQSTDSASARIAASAARTLRRLAPPDTRRQQSLHTAASRTLALVDHGPSALVSRLRRDRELRRAIGVADTPAARRKQYQRWLAKHTPSRDDLTRMRSAALALDTAPVVSLVMPVHDPDQAWLEAAIDSVLGQAYPKLELCIADDASTQPHVRSVLDRAAANDPRVRVVYRTERGGIAIASNTALGLATGEFVGFIDHDDVLRPHALYAMVMYLRDNPDADLVYSDEDKLFPDGTRGAPAFKPEYSPDRLLAENYINHLAVVRRSVVTELDGFRVGFDGSQDHDLMLRVSERARHIGHVPDVLYGWRMVAGSTAVSAAYKPLAQDAGRRAVDDALHRRAVGARVDFGPSPGLYIPRYSLAGSRSVDVLVVATGAALDARECAATIEALSTYTNLRVTIVKARGGIPASVNSAASGTTGEHIVLLDASTRVITPEWLELMLELSQRQDIGAVGARLRYADGGVAHEGMVLGRLGPAASADQLLRVVKEVSAVSGACLMTRRAVFEQAGGLDERFDHSLFDADYCMRVRELEHRVVCTPLVELLWGDAPSAARGDGVDSDARAFTDRWHAAGGFDDPYLNRNILWPNPLSLRLD